MTDPLINYRPGALWVTRDKIEALSEAGHTHIIKKDEIVFILGIVEESVYTHLKILYDKKIHYVCDVKDVRLTFVY